MKIQHYLVRLYPHVWRERYEDELLAMLEQRSLSFTDGANLFFSVLSMPIFTRTLEPQVCCFTKG